MQKLIKKAGYTQTSLANVLAIDQTTVGKWTQGISYPRADKLPILAKLLNCTEGEIIAAITESREKKSA